MFSCFRVPLADSRSRVTQHTAHMASTVHYKFKSQKDYDSVVFDGMFLSVGDLKRSIVDKKGLARDQACELLLTNAQNDEELVDDAAMVWKNTSVIVRRVPSLRAAAVGSEVGSTTQKKTVYVRPPEPLPNAPRLVRRVYPPTHTGAMRWSADGTAQHATPSGNGGEAPEGSIAALVNDAANAWETEKAAAAVRGGGGGGRGGGKTGFDPSGGKGGGRGGGRGDQNGPPPPGYTCFRCNVPGHWIHQCPTNGDQHVDVIRMKTAYGIPQVRGVLFPKSRHTVLPPLFDCSRTPRWSVKGSALHTAHTHGVLPQDWYTSATCTSPGDAHEPTLVTDARHRRSSPTLVTHARHPASDLFRFLSRPRTVWITKRTAC